jgi:hypothetical protein
VFDSVIASTLTSNGVGTPTYTSAGDFIFTTGNNLGTLILNGDLDITGTMTIASTTGTPSNTASPTGWLQLTVGSNVRYIPLYS